MENDKLPVLDLNGKFEAKYCIPMWLRDEHIRLSIKRVSKRLELSPVRQVEPVAVVGFGPSLKDTWKQIRNFKYVVSCSGSHRYLIDRGIIPTWHIEVDPRAHKVKLLGKPHKNVEYLIASCCSPALLDHLEGYNVRLWHVFDATDNGIRLLPQGEWAMTGGCDVGLRAITNAAFIGFRELHVFGIDGCEKSGARHAASHPNEKSTTYTCSHNGREFVTTGGLALAAKQVFHELDMMPKVKAVFYGDGLVQEMAKTYVPRTDIPEEKQNVIAASRPVLISTEYREQNRLLHEQNIEYGAFAGRRAEFVAQFVDAVGARTVLDYGCGKGGLGKAMPFPIWEYDPAIPGKEESPKAADFVCCLDVLEHIEPDKLGYVLTDLKRCLQGSGYFIICTVPSSKTYPNGKNAHLLVQDGDWWTKLLSQFFRIEKVIPLMGGKEMHYIVSNLAIPQEMPDIVTDKEKEAAAAV